MLAHQVVERVAYMFGQEKTLDELSAVDRGDARIGSEDVVLGSAYIKPPTTTRDWRGRVLLMRKKGSEQMNMGYVSLEMTWQQRKLPESEVLATSYYIDFAGMGISVMSPLTSGMISKRPRISGVLNGSGDESDEEDRELLSQHRPGDEFLYFCIQGVKAKADQYKHGNIACKVEVQRFQLDNQRADAAYPTLFSRAEEVPPDKPMLQMQVIQLPTQPVTTFEMFEILLQAMEIKLDLSLAFHLLDFCNAIEYTQDVAAEDPERSQLLSNRTMLKEVFYSAHDSRVVKGEGSLGSDLYFRFLNLMPVRLKLSLSINSDIPLSRILPSIESSPLLKPIAVVIMSASSLIANIDEAQLLLNCMCVQHLLASQQVIINTIKQHYTNQASC